MLTILLQIFRPMHYRCIRNFTSSLKVKLLKLTMKDSKTKSVQVVTQFPENLMYRMSRRH